MKLLVILLCLLSERFLVHKASFNRFMWFSDYFNAINSRLPRIPVLANPYLLLLVMVLPILVITGLLLLLFSQIIFGFIYLILNLIIFYYCLGPDNIFYPTRSTTTENAINQDAEHYFIAANGQVFAVIFWYILAGALGVLAYRLISLSRTQAAMASAAHVITNVLDWIPARLTVLLYLLVGNFQRGISFFTQQLLTSPDNNAKLLGQGGLLAASSQDNETISLTYAQSLVEHALVVYLVFLSFFTLVAWL